MSDPLSLSVDRENSLQDFDEFLGVEREEIDFARITDEQLDQYVGDGVTVVTNSVAGRMSEGYFMPIDDPTTAAVDGDDPAAAVDGAVNDTDGAEGITAEDPLPKMKRSRFSFAKRKVLAKGDQRRMHLGGFARKAHFKKWYKKSFFAILDCMLLNALVAWNLSANIPHLQRSKLERYEFYEWIAHDFLHFKEEEETGAEETVEKNKDHVSVCKLVETKNPGDTNRICAVCRLDGVQSGDKKGVKSGTLYCLICKTYIHEHVLNHQRTIHELIPGKTCHQIYKSEIGRQIWGQDPTTGNRRVKYSHPLIQQLREKLGLPMKRGKK
jgi:hypothetical protein